MTTVTRWWAPTGPHVGPDEIERTMLKGGGDVRKDIGQTLIALHRVGAAACEHVAKTPLAGEQDLVFTLAAARARSAPAAVDTISKGLGGGADPWLKDVLDDAERAALSLYRACIAKRVPHPVAAQRVGMVYGVPESYLGSFQRLATDLRTPPSVLTDAADRVLFDFVAKAGDQDVVEPKETFSKAPERERTRTSSLQDLFDQADRDYHGKDPGERDEQGQFARVGTKPAESSPVEVGTPGKAPLRPSELQAQKLARLQRLERLNRQQKQQRVARSKPTTAPPRMDVKMATPQMKAQMKAKMAQREMRSQMAMKVNSKDFTEAVEGRGHAVPLTPGEIPDMLAGNDHYSGAPGMDQQTAFLVLSDEFPALINAMGDGPNRMKVFRAGALQEYTRQVHRHIDMDTELEHPEMAEAVKGLADRVRRDRGIAEPVVVDVEELPGYAEGRFDPQDAREVTRLKLEFLQEQKAQGNLPDWASPVAELDHTDIVMSKESFATLDSPEKWVLVWHEPVWDSPLATRGRVNFTEIVVKADKAKGWEDGSGPAASEVSLDYNMGLGIRAGTKKSVVFDEQAKAYRTKIVAENVWDDDIEEAWERRGGDQWNGGKAMDSERFRSLERQGRIVRDKEGQFTDLQGLFDQAEQTYAEEAEQVAPPASTARLQRLERLNRMQRANRAKPAPATSATPKMQSQMKPRMDVRMTPAMKAQMRARNAAVMQIAVENKHDDPDPDVRMGIFVPGFDYSVVNRQDMALAMIRPAATGLGLLNEYYNDAVDDVQAELRAAQDEEHEDQVLFGGRTPIGKRVIKAQLDNEGLAEITRGVEACFEDPNVTHVELSTRRTLPTGAKEALLEVLITTNANKTDDITVVRWNEVSRSKPLQIRKGRNDRALSTSTVRSWVDGWYATAGDKPTHTLWLNNPHVQEYIVEPRDES